MDRFFTKRQKKIDKCEQKLETVYARNPLLRKIDGELKKKYVRKVRNIAGHNSTVVSGLDLDIKMLLGRRREQLESMGLDDSIYEPDWDCPICRDTGFVSPGVPCRCYLRHRSSAGFSENGLYGNLLDKKFSSFDISYYENPEKIGGLVKYMDGMIDRFGEPSSRRSNIFIKGMVGSGKTHFALASASSAADRGLSVLYRRFPDLMDDFRKEKLGGTESISRRARSVDLLVIDDLDVGDISSFTENQFRMLIEDRNILNLPWIILTNLREREIQEKYGQRVFDRLLENTYFYLFKTKTGESIRLMRRRKTAGKGNE